jgi:hypothetical protein
MVPDIIMDRVIITGRAITMGQDTITRAAIIGGATIDISRS